MSQPTQPTGVTPADQFCRVLALFSGPLKQAEIVEAWSAAQNPAARQSQLEFLYYDPDVQHDIIVVFDLLDRVKAGFFQAVFIAPPASTWSRSRHLGPTQTQLRSRAQPLGLPSLGALAQSRISEANRTLEVCTWLVQQALFARVPCVLLFPEDLGGHSYSGPSSPWALQDWRFLEGLGDARRGSAFLCRLAAADHRRPTGFITNLDELIDDIYLGWPRLLPIQQDLYYDGPLPKVCPCTTLHGDLVGRDPDSVFLSTSCPIIPAGLWSHFFRDLLAARSSSSLRVGAFPSASPATVVSSARLADAPGSWSWLYTMWQSGQLTRVALADVADSTQVQQYLSSSPVTSSCSTSSLTTRSRLLELVVFPASVWSVGSVVRSSFSVVRCSASLFWPVVVFLGPCGAVIFRYVVLYTFLVGWLLGVGAQASSRVASHSRVVRGAGRAGGTRKSEDWAAGAAFSSHCPHFTSSCRRSKL